VDVGFWSLIVYIFLVAVIRLKGGITEGCTDIFIRLNVFESERLVELRMRGLGY